MNRSANCPQQKCSGFTLIELLVVVLLIGVVLATAIRVMMTSTHVFSRETMNVSVQQNLAAVKNIVLDDLSVAGYGVVPVPTPPAASAFETVTTQSSADAVTFRADINSDGQAFADRICYQVSGTDLQRKVVLAAGGAAPAACGGSGFETLASDVSTFTLTFLNASRAVITAGNASQITGGQARYLDLLLTINPTVGDVTVSRTIHGEVALRNY